jgi:two-component system, OmpR family, response regulator
LELNIIEEIKMQDKKTIFIAEDDYDFLEQIKLFLTSEGYNVISASNEKDAEELINSNDFDLAVCDLVMDNMDSGFIISYKIKQKNKNIPVIMVSAVTKETGYKFDLSKNTNWIKADAFLNKNIRFEQLKGEINRLLLK